MYRDEVPRLAEWARENPDNLRRVLEFVILSIRQPFRSLDNALADVRRNKLDSAYLWGWKREAFEVIRADPDAHFANLYDAPVIHAIDYLAAEVPGFGIVKGAFVAQILGHDVACMDARNIEALGIHTRSFREFTRRNGQCVVGIETRHARIARYVQFTLETGGAEHWWDHWCEGLAPGMGLTGDQVSKLHWKWITKG